LVVRRAARFNNDMYEGLVAYNAVLATPYVVSFLEPLLTLR
jgi:hypothetical protein